MSIFSFLKVSFCLPCTNFFTDQNANIINPSEITFFQIFSSILGYRKQHRVAGDTVITEKKQNIPWKGNCLCFHSRKFRFAFSVQIYFTDQNANTIVIIGGAFDLGCTGFGCVRVRVTMGFPQPPSLPIYNFNIFCVYYIFCL